MGPEKELERRRLRATTKAEMAAAIDAVLGGSESPPFELPLGARTWLGGLLARPCRAHGGITDELCPGPAGDPPCRGSVRGDLVTCAHRCPGPPACPGSMGRFIACQHATIYEERRCGTWYAIPISCHVPGCPDCEPQRSAKLARHYEAVVALEDPRDVVLAVFTAQNPPAGELAPALRRHVRNLARIRRTPVFTGRGICPARTADGGPFHPCVHAEHRWICKLEHECSLELSSPHRGRRRRARRRCRILERRRRPCDHAACRPNCATYRHRGVAGGLWATECPPSTRTRGTWNLHTNAVLALRSDDDRRGLRWMAPWAELSWFWKRATCPTHRRCPGSPTCAGGAWDLDIQAYRPDQGIREYLKYVTKSAEILEVAGAAGLIEFLLARRRVKFLSAFGSFFGVKFAVDPEEQRAADELDVDVWVSDFQKRPMPKICPSCGAPADWDGEGVLMQRTELRLIAGYLGWRAPPVSVKSDNRQPAIAPAIRPDAPWLAPLAFGVSIDD